jgi:threonine dehydrogenase-like Zn-dependent dehydrogenase
MLGAGRVIAIDRFDYRLDKAREAGADDVLDYEKVSVAVALKELTGGRGPDACIDCVGLESHHPNPVVFGYDASSRRRASRPSAATPYAKRS